MTPSVVEVINMPTSEPEHSLSTGVGEDAVSSLSWYFCFK